MPWQFMWGNLYVTIFGSFQNVIHKKYPLMVIKRGLLEFSHFVRWFSNTLWLFNIAMENGPFIDGLPIKNWVFPWLC